MPVLSFVTARWVSTKYIILLASVDTLIVVHGMGPLEMLQAIGIAPRALRNPGSGDAAEESEVIDIHDDSDEEEVIAPPGTVRSNLLYIFDPLLMQLIRP